MKIKRYFFDISIGLVFTLCFLSFGVIFILNNKALYYFDINYLQIVEQSGYSKEIIISNYNTLIEYLSPFFKNSLSLPDFPSSQTALIHFAEVKLIFLFFYYASFICLFLLVFIAYYKNKKEDTHYLLVSSITMIIFPVLIAFACLINFDYIFILFHKILFQNNYWYFNPVSDPIITILPQTFFLHCAFVILAFLFIGSIILFIIYQYKTKLFDNTSVILASQENK